MTREEARKEFWQVSRDGYSGVFERAFSIKFNEVIKMPYHGSEFDKFINKIYDDFEQRIDELESPKECCKCIEANQMDMAHYNCTYFGKVKAKHYCSFYEPKETNDQDN